MLLTIFTGYILLRLLYVAFTRPFTFPALMQVLVKRGEASNPELLLGPPEAKENAIKFVMTLLTVEHVIFYGGLFYLLRYGIFQG